jgi:hypothetical protein
MEASLQRNSGQFVRDKTKMASWHALASTQSKALPGGLGHYAVRMASDLSSFTPAIAACAAANLAIGTR